MIYSERSWKMEHFLFLRQPLNRCSFRDNCVWNFEFVYKLFVVIHKLFWIFCEKIDFCINFLHFHKMNIVAIFIAKWDEQNDTKIIQFENCFCYWNKNSDSCFRFNNPKQCSNSIILVSFCSSHIAIKNYSYNVHLMKI
jgi:hypothetical protein